MMFTCFTAKKAPVTENHIRLVCGEVVTDWRDLGIVLGLDTTSMDNINADHSAHREKARKVLLQWKQKKGKGATVGILINALEEIERIDIAEKLLSM